MDSPIRLASLELRTGQSFIREPNLLQLQVGHGEGVQAPNRLEEQSKKMRYLLD